MARPTIIRVGTVGINGDLTTAIADTRYVRPADLAAEVVDAIAADSTVTDAAAAAVDAEILGRDILEAADILEDDPVFAVVDADGRRTWIEAGADGGPTQHSVDKISEHITGAVEMDSDATTLAFAIPDESGGRSDLELDTSGHIPDRVMALWTVRLAAALVSGPNLVAWGDSLTVGAGGMGASNTYPAFLAGLTGLTVTNMGRSGDTSAGIAGRQGGNPYLILPSGNTFPASGSVAVTVTTPSGSAYHHISDSDVGTVAGIHGTLASDGSGNLTFARTAAGDAVAVTQPQPLYLDDAVAHWDDIHLYWVGTNGIDDTDRIIGDVAAMIVRQGRLDRRYLVLGPLTPSDTGQDGSASHTAAETIEASHLDRYGRRFLNIRRYLIDHGLTDAGITPTAQDTTDIGNDVVPESLRSDALHLNATGYELVAGAVYARLAELEWV